MSKNFLKILGKLTIVITTLTSAWILLSASKYSNKKLVEVKKQSNSINDSSAGTVVYPLLIESAPLSKDLVIHRVFYDNRKRDGFQNATVFLY